MSTALRADPTPTARCGPCREVKRPPSPRAADVSCSLWSRTLANDAGPARKVIGSGTRPFIDQTTSPPIGGCSVTPLNGPIARVTPDRPGEILILMSPTLNAVGNDARGTAVIEAAPKGHQSARNEVVCPSIFTRIVARLRARPLDRLVEAGASPQPGSALEAHMVRLGSIGHRQSLAAELRRRATGLLCGRQPT
jgi:hypothetical protein